MSEDDMFYCSFVSIHYIICECGETFPSEDALKVHLEKEHPHKRERKEYKCGDCEALFSTEEACISHYEDNHIEEKQEAEHKGQVLVKEEEFEYLEYPDEQVVHYEDIIQDHVHHSDRVNRGYKAERGDLDYSQICEVCGEVYWASHKHVCYKSNKEVQRKLSVPNYTWRQKKSAVTLKKIICEVCGKKYTSNAALRYHQRLHTGERPYKCIFCPKSFTMPLFLQIHHRTHTGERPFKCPHSACTKAFSNKAALLRHNRVHTGEKPYVCPQCGKCFSQSNSMKLHVHTVHLKMPAPYKSKNRRTRKERLAAAMLEENENASAVKAMISDLPERLSEARMQVLNNEIVFKTEEENVILEDEVDRDYTYEIVYEE